MANANGGETYALTRRGTAPCDEDFVRVGDGWGVLLDGATGLGDQRKPPIGYGSLPQWYASTIGTSIANRMESVHDADELRGVIARAFASANDTFFDMYGTGMDASQAPSATLCIARHANGKVVLALLGDSPVIVIRDGRPETHALHDLDAKALETMDIASRTSTRHLSGTEKRDAISGVLVANRLMLGRPDGYWTLSPALPNAVTHAAIVTLPDDGVTAVYGMSDVAYAAISKYGIVTEQGIDKAFRDCHHASGVITDMRRVEHADMDFDRFPRFKVSDDASVFRIGL